MSRPSSGAAAGSAAESCGVGLGAVASGWLGRYGPMLLALYFVATTRWGSFLLPGPPYIADIALAALIAQRAWTLLRSATPQPVLSRVLTIPALLLLAFSIAVLGMGDPNETALRDAAPYFYAVLVLFGQSYRDISPSTIDRLVFGALVLHAAWFSVAEFLPDLVDVRMPGDSETLLFGIRADIDGAMLGVLAALALDRVMTGRDQMAGVVISAWALTLILLTQSRASLLATLAAVGFMLARWIVLSRAGSPLAPSADESPGRSRLALNSSLVAAVILLVPLVVTVVSGPPEAFQRSVNAGISAAGRPDAGSGRSSEGSGSEAGSGRSSEGSGSEGGRPVDTGVGTFEARVAGWKEVVRWILDDGPSRMALGAGFGSHYLQLSGADVAFFGPYVDPSIRAVHNYGLNTWARLGLVGLILVIGIAALAVVAAVRLSFRTPTPPTLDLFASLLVLAIPVVALMGVVLESPFGAIPYFWAVGYLSARMVEEGLWRPLKLPGWLAGDQGR